jgi:SAM-dependent methyltransferase
MNRDRLSALAHAQHPVAAPLSDASVDALVHRVARRRPERVLDVGCGAGCWLVRLLERSSSSRGVGVDRSTEALAAAARHATAAGVADRVEWRCEDASQIGDDRYDALLCVGSTHALGGLGRTLQALRARASDGAVAIVGDGFWEQPPGAAALAALDATADEFPSYAGLVAAVEAAGWAPVHVHASSPVEWDDYEWSWVSSLREWARAHPDDPDAADAKRLAAEHRTQWLDGYRGTLGFAVITAVLA